MQVYKTIKEVKNFIYCFRKQNNNSFIGFVPTMGALHSGHISLLDCAKKNNKLIICSIFVNPTQFNNPDDLIKYPRTPENDMLMLEKAGCDVLFMPNVEEMYPDEQEPLFQFNGLDMIMEGKFRPGHFNGVALVVKKFFEIIEPDNAYFGEKDFQQLAIVRQLVKTEKIPVNIVSCPIIREQDGLAMSSRNTRLTEKQRKIAPYIYATLKAIPDMFMKTSIHEIKSWVDERFGKYPEMHLEYFEIVDSQDLSPVSDDTNPFPVHCHACIAVFIGNIRLIDNIKIL